MKLASTTPKLSLPSVGLALDPGGTTGYTLFRVDVGKFHIQEQGEFNEWDELQRLIGDRRTKKDLSYHLSFIVYEKFSYVNSNVNPISLEVTGVIKYLAEANGIPLFHQIPQQMQFTEKRYPEFMEKFSGTHARDSLLHAIHFAYFSLGVKGNIIFSGFPIDFPS